MTQSTNFNSLPKHFLTEKIKAEALCLGFSACGVALAKEVDKENQHYLRQWLTQGCQAGMGYMENHFEKRCNPDLLVENTRSIIVVALNYYPPKKLPEDQYQFAWYAYGKDYHEIMRNKLSALYSFIQQLSPSVKGRFFCDTAPILERYWAWRAGLGWIGKNTQLIIPHTGSCFFLGEIFIDKELEPDLPKKQRCGNCKRCLEACPTHALEMPYQLNSTKCLSYLTIENRESIPEKQTTKLGNCIYGCDECQKACPWNRFSRPTRIKEFFPSEKFLQMRHNDWEKLTETDYGILFKESAVKRAKYRGLMRNITVASQNKGKNSENVSSDSNSNLPL